jgi:hypothetical protein
MREMQIIKMTLRFHLTSVKMALQRKQKIIAAVKYVGENKPFYGNGENVNKSKYYENHYEVSSII